MKFSVSLHRFQGRDSRGNGTLLVFFYLLVKLVVALQIVGALSMCNKCGGHDAGKDCYSFHSVNG